MKALTCWIAALQQQYKLDMRQYQQAHRHVANRWLHKLLVPIEAATTCQIGLVLLWYHFPHTFMAVQWRQRLDWLLKSYVIVSCVFFLHWWDRHDPPAQQLPGLLANLLMSWLMMQLFGGLVSRTAHQYRTTVDRSGLSSARSLDKQQQQRFTDMLWVQHLRPLLTQWTAAWLLQIVLGHGCLERNRPNLMGRNPVSWLAMLQSVLIAWQA